MKTKGVRRDAKADRLRRNIEAVGAGLPAMVETVDFGDPERPRTCLEVDFPIIPVNQVAVIEGNAGKPIYQMSKWWARRRSSVFRSLLLAAAMKAPQEPESAAKAVWDAYYANHQKNQAFKRLKVADIFMGGGTTLVEGTRLGMQVFGTDLNPVAWFVVRNELARVEPAAVAALLGDVEREVKPQVMPFYACDCPRGHKGTWIRVDETGKEIERMGPGFDPLAIEPGERRHFRYEGPEVIYAFWAKHGPCQVTGCGHRTPIFTSPVVAVKTLSVKAWPDIVCPACGGSFDLEAREARMAPGVPLVVSEGERPYFVFRRDSDRRAKCPLCAKQIEIGTLSGRKSVQKKIELSLLIHPDWLRGSPGLDERGNEFGGSATDTPGATAAWNAERARSLRLVEARGTLPETIVCPETGKAFSTRRGTVSRKSHYECGATCGKENDVLGSIRASSKTGPIAVYAIQGFCPACKAASELYDGRFFDAPRNSHAIDTAVTEWACRQDQDLKDYWPRSDLPFGFMTHVLNGGIPNHGFTHWWKMFHPRQLLVHAQLLRAIVQAGGDRHTWETREFVLGVFQQYLRNQNLFAFWHLSHDHFAPALSNNNFHPKATVVEVGAFTSVGYGPWPSTYAALFDSLKWSSNPWEIASTERLRQAHGEDDSSTTKSVKLPCGDPVLPDRAAIACVSATDLPGIEAGTYDLVITDPPFGGLLHYSELSDFFYVWLRLVLKDRYPDLFSADYTPKALEASANRARVPDPDAFYQRILTQCWREAHRILKPGGILAFTFHHSEDDPWIAVLESLFEAGFYLEATYPIRSDETKGEGEFGSKKIEYDMIHVCRKRLGEPEPVSWASLRRRILEDVNQLQAVLEHHTREGLPAADLQVIRRGKALEHFSRHYGKVYLNESRTIEVREAVTGILQLLDEASSGEKDVPPHDAEPLTRQFLRIFRGRCELARDQMQKLLRGTGTPPQDFVDRGWCLERKRVFHLVEPSEHVRAWAGNSRRSRDRDYDQALFSIGACCDGSGISLLDVLKEGGFRLQPALSSLLEWHARQGASECVRDAAARALTILKSWRPREEKKVVQQTFLFGEGG